MMASSSSSSSWITKARAAIVTHASWLFPLLVVVVGIVPSVLGLRAQTFAIFGRDQGIFQYVAWALRHGDRAYRDIHEINGPLPHAWHIVMQKLGGEDEHVFRTIDCWMLVAIYAFAAITIPRWVGLDLGDADDGRARRKHFSLVVWILAGLTVMGSQYVRYDWWHTAQREAFYSLLVLASLALQSIVHSTDSKRNARIALLFAAIFSSLAWFGKPPCAIFSLLQVLVYVFDRKSIKLSLRASALIAIAGAFLVGIVMLVFVVVYEDLGRGIELLSKVPNLHHTIWNATLLGEYQAFNNGPKLDWAFVTFAAFLATYRLLKLPRRALLTCVLPIGGILVFAGQGKAFPYHLHMVTLGTAVAQLVIVAALARYVHTTLLFAAGPSAELPEWKQVLPFAAAILSLGLGVKCMQDAWLSPAIRGDWAHVGATKQDRATAAYVDHFPWGDFFPNDLRTTAAYLQFHTRPDERVQTYGFDPYLLFLARRKSASPVIYNFELNVDAALKGGPGARPSPELADWLRAYRDETEDLVLAAVDNAPPAAFVLFDRAPWTFPENSEEDFAEHCPKLTRFMTERYVFAAMFGTVRVWLRRDVLARGTL